MPKWAYAALVAATPAVTVPDDWPDGWDFPGPPWPPGFEDDEDDGGISYFEVVSPADDETEASTSVTLEWEFDLDGESADSFEVFIDGVKVGDTSDPSYSLSDLDYETAYEWRVVARVGSTYYVGPVWSFTTKITAPSALTATAASSTQISLTWNDNSAVEDNYLVERSLNGSTGWTQIASKVAGSMSHSDTGLTASTAYYYRVRAYDATLGYSDYSSTANATTSSSAINPTNTGYTKTKYEAYPPTTLDKAYDGVVYGVRFGQMRGAAYADFRGFATFAIPAGSVSSAKLRVYVEYRIYDSDTAVISSCNDYGSLSVGDHNIAVIDTLASVAFSTLTQSAWNEITLDHTKITAGQNLYVRFASSNDINNSGAPAGSEYIILRSGGGWVDQIELVLG